MSGSRSAMREPHPPPELVAACVEGRCVLYAGAGLTADAGYPTWRLLIEGLLDWIKVAGIGTEGFVRSLWAAAQEGDLDLVADGIHVAAQESGHEEKLHEFLRAIFIEQEKPPTKRHGLLQGIGFAAALTTNFDRLLERVFDCRPLTPTDTEELLALLARREFFLLELYGSLERSETVLLAPAQYEETIVGNRAFSDFMDSLFVSRTLFFVGCSLDGILTYLEGIRLRGVRRRHFALVAVENHAWEAKADLLRRRYGIEVLPYSPADPSHPEVEAFLRELRDRVRAERDVSFSINLDRSRPPRSSSLASLQLRNIGAFEKLDLDLDPHWNVLLGDNGVGKSTILRAIALGICGRDAQPFAERLLRRGAPSAEIVLRASNGHEYVTLIERTSGELEVKTLPGRPLETEGWLALGFPALRLVSWQPLRGPQLPQDGPRPTAKDLLPLLSGELDPRLDQLKQWILNLDYQIKTEQASGAVENRSARLLEAFFAVIGRLTGELRLEFRGVDLERRQVMVVTDDGEVPIEAVSQGTASLLGWIGILMQRLYEVFDDAEKPAECPAIVLIDELDAHMHPSWQQSLVGELSAIFPEVQFIATSHSPLIVSGRPVSQVRRFARGEEGRVVELEVPEDMTMGRADQVLTGRLFGLDTTVDQETRQRIEEYQRLLGKRHRTPEEEKEFRRLGQVLEFRLPVPVEGTVERRAMELLRDLLRQQVGIEESPSQEQLLERARQLVIEVARQPEVKS